MRTNTQGCIELTGSSSAANAVIDLAAERFTKNLWTDRAAGAPPQLVHVRDEADQGRFIAEKVIEIREGGSTLKQQAVLFRASHHSGPLEIELTRRNVPFVKFGGLKFLDSAHIKDLLALLRFIENPRDRVAGFRVLQLLPGVGPTSAQRVLDHIAQAPAPIDALQDAPAPQRAGVTGPTSSLRSASSARDGPTGRARSSAPDAGTNRISNASTKTPPPGRPNWCNSSRSQAATLAGGDPEAGNRRVHGPNDPANAAPIWEGYSTHPVPTYPFTGASQ